ncbi:hypothetical protein BDDG_03533 [Blastomyces dermatitidis ATCC 18188]|uniref:Protein BNI4 n=1 Tax=Ajellomyces dermatitidis (strain ATCC 18188 / CBS 674.68) TaxID=653446 RepID=F2TBK5_AJEDA|nr:hypothetical protein BDDG_03533 [Blastomyces dermatitidis ATCC 18188]
MAALVQTIPQQTSSITLLQPRPSSSTASFPSSATSTLQQHSQMARNQQPSRASYNNVLGHGNGSGSGMGYRASQAGQPVAPYAFTSTPSLTNTGSSHTRQNAPHLLKTEHRAVSAPSASQSQANPTFPGVIPSRVHFPAAGSVFNSSPNIPSSVISQGSKDDSAIPTKQWTNESAARPLSSMGSTPSLSSTSPTTSTKPSPDRYRRGQRRTESQNGAGNASSFLASGLSQPSFAPGVKEGNAPYHSRVSSADDAFTANPQSSEQAKRYRRRSLGSLDITGLPNLSEQKPAAEPLMSLVTKDFTLESPDQRPHSAHTYSHAHKGSTESVSSTRSSPPTGKRAPPVSSSTTLKLDHKLIDNSKRATNPSPLSQPIDMSPESSKPKPTTTTNPATESSGPMQAQPPSPSTQAKVHSPAAKRLTELSKKGFHKSGKSRLRRALSFGSVAELRAASAQEPIPQAGRPGQEVSRKQQLDEELGAEQAAIAEKQEANGLGENIYSGQGHIFSGSMDNLSISSTASSASIMLRKMGKGVRRSTRSLVGLFRPKSTPNPEGDTTAPVEPMTPQVSIVNVEAERGNGQQASNNTALEEGNDINNDNEPGAPPSAKGRSSVESGSTATGGDHSSTDSIKVARKSILGGEKERAEVLAAVRKGILKRSGAGSNTSSPTLRPVEFRGTDVMPVPHIHDSPHSSAPSTPNGDRDRPPRSGHRRTDSVTIEGEDYFLPAGRFGTTDSSSAPVTPQTVTARNISFSPRIQFHDTWPSGEYDRRGDIATCNRLTPLLAQQIKEELNTFKMEMEVHESSKVYTHFF